MDKARFFFRYFMQPLNRPWRSYLHIGKAREIAKGHIAERDSSRVCYLESGLLRAGVRLDSGAEKTLCFLTPDNFFGDTEHFSRVETTEVLVFRALEPSRIVDFDRDDFDTLMSRNPSLMYNLLESTSYTAHLMARRALEPSEYELRTRLCHLLFDLAAYNGFAHVLKPRITQKDVADILEVHRCTLSRAISELREEQIIGDFTKNTLVIKDMEALMEAARISLPAVNSFDYSPVNWQSHDAN